MEASWVFSRSGRLRYTSAVPTAKAGRNDLCPCGSGKKYKKCCLGKDEAGRRQTPPQPSLPARVAPAKTPPASEPLSARAHPRGERWWDDLIGLANAVKNAGRRARDRPPGPRRGAAAPRQRLAAGSVRAADRYARTGRPARRADEPPGGDRGTLRGRGGPRSPLLRRVALRERAGAIRRGPRRGGAPLRAVRRQGHRPRERSARAPGLGGARAGAAGTGWIRHGRPSMQATSWDGPSRCGPSAA